MGIQLTQNFLEQLGAVETKISEHNADPTAHSDIRAEITDSSILDKIKNVDGSGSGLDADKVDGYDASQTPASNTIPVADTNGNLNNWIAQGSGSGLDADLVRGLPADFTNNIGTSGYQKLPSGLIIQWGLITINNDATNPNTATTVSLPIAFPNAGISVVASCSGQDRHIVSIGFLDKATLEAWSYDPINNTYPDTTTAYFIAVGY